ncbi:PREDICTED: PLASTID MOVEMENT IMPAIRED [Prunus dulcis]|uniref:PREDICTED: PLASTID MOVEMENT IMPAIRED n=1 Tax=Prunus dulcis TaxID=3755 RepID=A0A5E4E4G1_PRUDU|nr:protein PLASTID MOVEMENT IMPAIRED 1-RELATED 1 [Prunus dulcis]XP_034223389.1 protein PLASTID MOVEMENT IMPAIRED 1-RELATED 1 [Prunus dulcis]VVA10282.1 PREDICTED: PLASTID MOVEMENT IMPAIRED [Prunus dulcis]
MLSNLDGGRKRGGDSGNGKLLNEIETISKALYVDKNPSRSSIPAGSNPSGSIGKSRVPDPKSKPKSVGENLLAKEKRSFWNWKPLKAFSHIRNRRFNCCFSLQVHSIEGLPSALNEISLCVHWKRRDGIFVTNPVKVVQGTAKFEEKLTHTCSVYGSRSGPHHSAKYEAKHFLLYASVFGAPELDLGKHRIDLTRLLPLTLEELEEEKSSGNWTTSFRLSGKAKGGSLNVSFGYTVLGDNPSATENSQNVPEVLTSRQNNSSMATTAGMKYGQVDSRSSIRRAGTLPKQRSRASSQSVEDIKDLHEVLPISRSELSSSVNTLYQKFDEEEKSDTPVDYKPELDVCTEHLEAVKTNPFPSPDSGQKVENGCENDFSVVEQGIELPANELKESEVITQAADASPAETHFSETTSSVQVAVEGETKLESQVEEKCSYTDDLVVCEFTSREDDLCTKESLMKELESALDIVSDLERAALESPEDKRSCVEGNRTKMMGRSHSLDEVTESVANEFLSMLGMEHSPFSLSSESDPESPRERLLRQFEQEALAGGFSLFNFEDIGNGDQAECGYAGSTESGWENLSDSFELSSVIQAAEEEHQIATQEVRSKEKAKMLEDLETESLMLEWGLNEMAFQHSPPKSSASFGSPIDLPAEEPLDLPPLGEGLGPFLQTKNGGFLRSMNPSLFSNAKSGGNLIMQVSNPVVVPAEMGSGVIEILQHLASVGIEKLSMQANKLMPLEDITGKTMEQVAWEAVPALEGPRSQRECLMQHEPVGHDTSDGVTRAKGILSGPKSNKFNSSAAGNEMGLEYVSLEDLAPLAMDKIEALSIEGLRIQSGMSDADAPSNINAQSVAEIAALQGKGVNVGESLGLEGAAGLQLLDIKDSGNDVDGLMGLSLTLDEWLKLDSGEIDDEDHISERTSKILAAHHANSLDMIRGGSKGERRRGKGASRKCGLLGNNFTVALMVQLRDPLRNYEPVGAPMLSLVQVERVFLPPKPKIYSTVSELRCSNEEDDDSESVGKEKIKEERKDEKSSEVEAVPQFRITEVHVAGLKTEPDKKKPWGTASQKQSGSRWLLANGMGKNNKHPFLKSKAVPKSSAPATTKVQSGDTLWSISSRVHGTGEKWKELAALNPHIRNPNVIFPNETIRLC